MDTSMTTQIYGTNGQEWSLLSTQSKRPLSSIILDPMECEVVKILFTNEYILISEDIERSEEFCW